MPQPPVRPSTSTPVPEAQPLASHESAIAKMLDAPAEASWRLPVALTQRLPFAAFAVTVQKAGPHQAREVLIECVLPSPEATTRERARFKLRADAPRYALHVTESSWCAAMAWAGMFGLPLAADDALALLVGERLAKLSIDPAPHGRPFVVEWVKAVEALAAVTMQMHWQAKALGFDRGVVHKVCRAFRDDALRLSTGWGHVGREGIVT